MDLYQVHTIVDIARIRANSQGSKPAYIFLENRGENEATITFGELDRKARIIAGYLNHHGLPGARVALFFPPGLDYIVAFMGCLYAGMTAVPLTPPRPDLRRFHAGSILRDCGATMALTNIAAMSGLRLLLRSQSYFESIHLASVQDLPERYMEDWRPLSLQTESLAFLQYSGSGSHTPRGIMISHGNLMENAAVIARAFDTSSNDIGLNWLPLNHDMGLIGTIFQAIFKGFTSILMPSMAFIRDPLSWLEAISRYRATLSGGPNFAYELCVRKASLQRIRKLDLSCWRVAFNGAQPVKPHTLQSFARKFAKTGYRPEAMLPCYGLAEATLFVSGGSFEEAPKICFLDKTKLAAGIADDLNDKRKAAVALVSYGTSRLDDRVLIVNPAEKQPARDGEIGEIWVSGPGIARGYWDQPELTEKIFGCSLSGETTRYLRTGDMGFVRDGELFVTGRRPDLMALQGSGGKGRPCHAPVPFFRKKAR